jgi:hypothetical protein
MGASTTKLKITSSIEYDLIFSPVIKSMQYEINNNPNSYNAINASYLSDLRYYSTAKIDLGYRYHRIHESLFKIYVTLLPNHKFINNVTLAINYCNAQKLEKIKLLKEIMPFVKSNRA